MLPAKLKTKETHLFQSPGEAGMNVLRGFRNAVKRRKNV